MPNKMILIISGPSGAGKNTCIKQILKKCSDARFITPFTTRAKRHDETNDKDYHFISHDDFLKSYNKKEIIDWDYTLNNYYGFFKTDFENDSNILITHALAKMALRMKSNQLKNCITIFIEPLDVKETQQRITLRDHSKKDLEIRLQHGVDELVHKNLFDYSFISFSSQDTANDIVALIENLKKI